MSYADNPYRSLTYGNVAANASVDERADFIRKTYLHLAGAVFAFMGLEAVLLKTPGLSERFFELLGASRYSWLVVVGGFVLVSYVAEKWARSATSVTVSCGSCSSRASRINPSLGASRGAMGMVLNPGKA